MLETVSILFWRCIHRLNSEKFHNFSFKPEFAIFLRINHKNDDHGEFPDFYEFNLYMIFEILAIQIMTTQIMAIYVKN